MGAKTKRTLEIKILSEAETGKADVECAIEVLDGVEYLTLISSRTFFEVFNSRRWEIVVKLQTVGQTSIRALAKEVGRDMRRVHDDVKFLISRGIIEQDEKGVCVPYDTIHAEFTLSAAAT